jgi:hypothetical membrane protein
MRGDPITVRALGAGVAVPFLYYGAQAIAAPFFPGFSFLGTTASELGSDHSAHPFLFNGGAILLGVAGLVAAVGFFRAFRLLGTHPILAWLTSIALAVSGLSSLWAGCFPLPDPRHAGHPAFLIAMLSLPPFLAVAIWRRGHVALNCYLLANLFPLAVMIPIMSGVTALDTHIYRGLLQRIFALTVFLPIGVAAYVLATRTKALASPCC